MSSIELNKIYQGDCRNTMREWSVQLEGKPFIHTCVTSPPYFGLRDYGIESQIGLEENPRKYIDRLVEVFREVRRNLRDDGTLWLNLGDSYASDTKGAVGSGALQDGNAGSMFAPRKFNHGVKQKDLIGIPWAVAFALRDDGWYLRSDIIWAKPNPMPESVTDRPTKSHEYIFLFSKNPDYFYDSEAIKEKAIHEGRLVKAAGADAKNWKKGKFGDTAAGFAQHDTLVTNRNKRSVWTVSLSAFEGSHFATFPPNLIKPCIMAGTSEYGVCGKCGRQTERQLGYDHTTTADGKSKDGPYAAQTGTGTGTHDVRHGVTVKTRTIGWTKPCACEAGLVPGVVLDPFMGAGTTALVALEQNRQFIGCELNPEYIKIACERIANERAQGKLF